jgi:hypoxanthine phosphoribosyltransferase
MTRPVKEVTPLFDAAEIAGKVAELALRIESDYRDLNPVLVCVLKGAFIFLSDLTRRLTIPHVVDFVRVSSYGSSTSTSGNARLLLDATTDVQGRHVLIVEDILDTGLTLSFLLGHFAQKRPASLKVCALLHKPARSRVPVRPDYCGFVVPDRFLVGYGLDRDEQFRCLPFIGSVDG